MSRSERLFDLLDVLRRHRFPVSGQALADELGISLRTLYRDIASLQAMGADVAGEPGVGYVLRPGFLLPLLSFPAEEIEALVLGARWVAKRGDESLRQQAESALARIAAAFPAEMRAAMEAAPLLVGPGAALSAPAVDPVLLRKAIRTEHKLAITYRDGADRTSTRVIWPFAYAFFDQVRLLVGWCEWRADFRSFRADRIESAELLDARAPKRRQVLLAEWRKRQGLPPGA
ncbi:putative DNA-binding transcriptional regulator YafY [Rhodobacter viridis]|uniref:Putative DNA-binding transcriptional regulator YafY n=1 Tax=Rhodobacter viridis TaxID=1054202 RepID=A0A318U222_9RHOB|nr:YafY family protein [Rhodobacter viridis]PYF10228.1 putative DNA-binding transcriptional regulator YafY [Rhodobacter viridis]